MNVFIITHGQEKCVFSTAKCRKFYINQFQKNLTGIALLKKKKPSVQIRPSCTRELSELRNTNINEPENIYTYIHLLRDINHMSTGDIRQIKKKSFHLRTKIRPGFNVQGAAIFKQTLISMEFYVVFSLVPTS